MMTPRTKFYSVTVEVSDFKDGKWSGDEVVHLRGWHGGPQARPTRALKDIISKLEVEEAVEHGEDWWNK